MRLPAGPLVLPRALALAGTLTGALLLPLGALSAPAAAQSPTDVALEARRDLSLTVYQNGLGLVEESRWVPLAPGDNLLAVHGVSERIVAPSLIVSAEGLTLRDQAWRPADLTPRQLLESAVGGRVRLVREHPETGETISEPAVLLSLAGGPVLRVGERIEIDPPGRIVLERLPQGLSPEPRLRLAVRAEQGGPREIGLAYLVEGLSWQADYVATLDAGGDAVSTLSLTGLLTVGNGTDVLYEDAALSVVAGEVARIGGAQPYAAPAPAKMMRAEMAAADSVPAPESVGERHLYDTGRRVDLAPGETRQLVLFQDLELEATRRLRFDGLVQAGGGPEEVGPMQPDILVAFDTPAEGPAARPLPAGTLRLYDHTGGAGEDAAEAPTEARRLFAGEARLEHTPAGGQVELTVGQAFDVTGRSRVTAFERLSDRSYEIAQEITVANAKDEAVSVEVAGRLPRGWQLLEESRPHETETASRIVWTLEVPAGGETSFRYRMRVSR